MAYGQRDPIFRLLPRKKGHLGVWRQHSRFFRHGVGMRLGVIRHDKDRRCALTYEIARHTENEIIIFPVHFSEEGRAHFHCDIRPPLAQRWCPVLHVVPIEKVGHFGPEATWHRWHGGYDALGSTLQHSPDEGAADAKAEHHEPVDPQMIHQSELVVAIRIPWPIDLHRARGPAAGGVPQIHRYTSVFVTEYGHRVEWRPFG